MSAPPSATPLTPASISSLISNNLYDPRIIPTLEDYVLQQVRTSTYDFPPNRHLLSLYLTSPDSIKHDVLKHLLLLSLSAFPASHFLSLSYTLPSSLQSQDPYRLIARLHSLLSTGQYKRYWQEKDHSTALKGDGWTGYDERVRRMIAGQVEKMYARVSVFTMMELWAMTRGEVEERVKEVGWRMEEDGKMIKVGGGEKAGQGKGAEKRNEVLSEEQLAKLLAIVQAS